MRFVTTCILYILLTATLLFSGSRQSDTLGQDGVNYRQNIREWKHEQIREFNELLVKDVDSLFTFTTGLSEDSIFKPRGEFDYLISDTAFIDSLDADFITTDTLASVITILGDGGATDYINITIDGDMFFNGGAGLPFGSNYGNEIDWTQTNAAQNTWYKINDADIVDTLLHNMTGNSAGRLIISNAGYYCGAWSVSSSTSVSGDHVQITFEVNSGAINGGMNHYESFGVSKNFPISGNGLLNLAEEDTVGVFIRTTDSGTPDLHVDHVNITLFQIGGGG